MRLIDDLLDVSRITAGKLPMRKSQVQLAAILNLALETARPHCQQSGHHLTVSLPPEPVYLDGDSARLAQVFANLLHNASKYTEPGGEIRLSACVTDGGEAEVSVRDNGIGIPQEFLPRLFEKFSQVAPDGIFRKVQILRHLLGHHLARSAEDVEKMGFALFS